MPAALLIARVTEGRKDASTRRLYAPCVSPALIPSPSPAPPLPVAPAPFAGGCPRARAERSPVRSEEVRPEARKAARTDRALSAREAERGVSSLLRVEVEVEVEVEGGRLEPLSKGQVS